MIEVISAKAFDLKESLSILKERLQNLYNFPIFKAEALQVLQLFATCQVKKNLARLF